MFMHLASQESLAVAYQKRPFQFADRQRKTKKKQQALLVRVRSEARHPDLGEKTKEFEINAKTCVTKYSRSYLFVVYFHFYR